MKAWKNVLILFALTLAIEGAYMGIYYAYATHSYQEIIAEHTATLESGTLPSASEINLENGAWIRVANFESTSSQLLFVADTLTILIVAGVLLFSGVSAQIKAWSRRLARTEVAQNALYIAAYAAITFFISLPLTLSVYVIGYLRGTVYSPFSTFLPDQVFALFMAVLFTVITYVPLYWIMRRFKRGWWMWGALLMSAIMVFFSYIYPSVIAPFYYVLQPLEPGAVSESISPIIEPFEIPVDQIYVSSVSLSSYDANAMVLGVGNTKRIVLDDNLLTFFSPEEIRFFVAHEVGHYLSGDSWKMLGVSALLWVVDFAVLLLVLTYVVARYGTRLGTRDARDIALFPLVIAVLTLMPMINAPIISGISRSMERQADAYAISVTQDPAAGISSMARLSYLVFADQKPPALLQWWFGTHPTMKERIETMQNAAE